VIVSCPESLVHCQCCPQSYYHLTLIVVENNPDQLKKEIYKKPKESVKVCLIMDWNYQKNGTEESVGYKMT